MRDVIEWLKGLVTYRQLKRGGVELKVFYVEAGGRALGVFDLGRDEKHP